MILTNERISKEIISSLKYKHSFLFFLILYKLSILKIIFTKLHLLCLLSDLFKFNHYINFSNHIWKIIYFIFDYSNNTNLKFSIIFFKLNYFAYFFFIKKTYFKYKRINSFFLVQYKKKFQLSKKHCNFIIYLSNFYSLYYILIYNKPILIYNILNIINFCKNKITLINILLICFLDEKYNAIINKFYNKYFILDILNIIYIQKKYKKNTNMYLLNKIKNTIQINRKKYNNIMFYTFN